jgi:hypothetical protein
MLESYAMRGGSDEIGLSVELLSQHIALPELPEVDVCNVQERHVTPDCSMLFAETDKRCLHVLI